MDTSLKKWCWRCGLILFGILVSSITWEQQAMSRTSAKADRDSDRTFYTGRFSEILKSVEALSTEPKTPPTITRKKQLADLWGKVTVAEPPTKGRSEPPKPVHRQITNRHVDPEQLGKALRGSELASATVINDGTVEGGAFAKQLQVGLQMAGWQVGGNNVKIGDPDFFPDGLTIEVSAVPLGPDDHSIQEAKAVKAALEKQNIDAALRFTDLHFPPNFMRVKVAGR